MKRKKSVFRFNGLLLLASCLFFFTFLNFQNCAAQSINDEYKIANQLIVHFQNPINQEIQNRFPEFIFRECLSKRMNIWLVQKSKGAISESELNGWKENSLIAAVQFNHKIEKRSIVPNDPFFSYQWSMLNTGQNSGTAGSDIDATLAWQINHNNLTQVGDSIVIAVIEDKVDIYHEDLNYFVNYNEIPNNSIDDDGNGFVDDYWGWSVYDSNDSVYGSASHGTHVAGIAGAKGDNGKGIAGVCWGVKILAIDGSSELESDVVKAYDYTIAMRDLYNVSGGSKGAFVVATNSSFGVGQYGANPVDFPIWCAMYDSLGKYGILSAVSSPNRDVNVDVVHDVPSECPSKFKIGVTNSDRNDGRNFQCAYGVKSVDLGAPGTSIFSTLPNNTYNYLSGTSMSSPHVTGAVAAMYAAACPKLVGDYKAYPDSLALIMKEYMLQGTDKIASMKNRTASDGRLNLYKSFLEVANYNCNNCNYHASIATNDNSCNLGSDGQATLSVSGSLSNYTIHWSNDTMNKTVISNLSAGNYTVTITETGGCERTLNFFINEPSVINVTSINIVPIASGSGNIVIVAKAGNDSLQYALDNGSYQSNGIFSVSTAGKKTIHIKNENGCVKDTTIGIYYTDIEEISGIEAFQIYPNPTKEKLNLLLKANGAKEVRLLISDVLGRNIFSKNIFLDTTINNTSIDVTQFQQGFYNISIMEGERVVRTKVLVIQ